ncbi:MAG: PEGA domain-containing protein [Patescibacteria group bacterium]|nr:PEGA domain-containing protein [Patescibacteria group bacterium]
MEYPNSKLTKPYRRGILIAFVALFFILAPAIIMYTSGYRYDWQRGLLRETGAINVDVEPASAAVYLNEVKMKSKMPVRINDRIPGRYNIRVAADGYYDWRKEVEVENKQTVYIKEISIIRKNAPAFYLAGKITDLQMSFDNRYLAYELSGPNGKEIRLKNLADASDILLYAAADKKVDLTWAPASNYLALSDATTTHQTLLVIDAAHPEKIIDVIGKTKSQIKKFQWKETAEPELYYSTDLKLMTFFPATEQRAVLAKNTWRDWYMENGQLWTIETASNTEQIKIVGDALGFKYDFAGPEKFSETEQNLELLRAKDNTVLLKKSGQPEMILLAKDKKYTFAGEKFLISRYNDWWIMWTPWEIWTYTKNEEPNLLNRSGEQLRVVLPLDQYNTLALVWANKTTALYPYYLVTHDLVNAAVESAVVDAGNKTLYFTAQIGEQEGVWRLNY